MKLKLLSKDIKFVAGFLAKSSIIVTVAPYIAIAFDKTCQGANGYTLLFISCYLYDNCIEGFYCFILFGSTRSKCPMSAIVMPHGQAVTPAFRQL